MKIMFDTVILTIPKSGYWITDNSKFSLSAERMLNNPIFYYKYINNPTAEDEKKGIYKPRLTITKRGMAFDLKIEFSAPKLLFDNNLNELEETDFNAVVAKLKKRIEEMGVKIYTQSIGNAKISAFHPSKNILLSKGYTSTLAIKELAKINLNGKFDLEKIKFRNNGQSLQFYTNSHSFVFYDKIKDMGKSKKRAIDKDQTLQQFDLFNWNKKSDNPFEILRFEIRLSKKRKVNEILEQIGYPINPTFKDVFKKDLCQKIINLYWNKFFEKENMFIFDVGNSPQVLLEKILTAYPKLTLNKALYLQSLLINCKDEEGVRGLKTVINGYKPKTTWTRINNDLKKFKNPIFSQNTHGFIADIQRELKEFTTYKHKPP